MRLLSISPPRIVSVNFWSTLNTFRIHADKDKDKKKIVPATTSAPTTTGEPIVPPQPQIRTS